MPDVVNHNFTDMTNRRSPTMKEVLPVITTDVIKKPVAEKRHLLSSITKKCMTNKRGYWGKNYLKPEFWPAEIDFNCPSTNKASGQKSLCGEDINKVLLSYVSWNNMLTSLELRRFQTLEEKTEFTCQNRTRYDQRLNKEITNTADKFSSQEEKDDGPPALKRQKKALSTSSDEDEPCLPKQNQAFRAPCAVLGLNQTTPTQPKPQCLPSQVSVSQLTQGSPAQISSILSQVPSQPLLSQNPTSVSSQLLSSQSSQIKTKNGDSSTCDTKQTEGTTTKPSPMETSSMSTSIPVYLPSSTLNNTVAVSFKPRSQKIFNPDELQQSLMPVLEKLYKQDPESMPFRQPVDPVSLGIADYFDIVKTPMDLSLIQKKLDTGQYADPWQFCDDVWMMIDNAWLYNGKNSECYLFSLKLTEVFVCEIDDVMKSLGYCCGRKYVYSCPKELDCHGKPNCAILKDAVYYRFHDRYMYCKKCFNEIQGDEVELTDATRIKKNQFEKMKNDQLDNEPFVQCNECGRQLHQVCVLHFDQIWTNGFTCDNCYKARGIMLNIAQKIIVKCHSVYRLNIYLKNRPVPHL